MTNQQAVRQTLYEYDSKKLLFYYVSNNDGVAGYIWTLVEQDTATFRIKRTPEHPDNSQAASLADYFRANTLELNVLHLRSDHAHEECPHSG